MLPSSVQVPMPPEHHLDRPAWWIVISKEGQWQERVPDVTAISVVTGYLILWRHSSIVGVFRPETGWGAAHVTAPPYSAGYY